MKPAEPHPAATARREWAFVAAVTALGLAVRIWGLGRLGLAHFDEGIYAIAGLWSLGPGGIDPLVIPYAPPGYPGLVGLAYLVFGPSDAAAILVSIATGTLAVPASAWLARRTFGPGAGAVAAALASLSAFHVAFSRMALTDATATLAWLLGLIAAQRFLERPGAASAAALGLATGLAQLAKYSGWTVGAAAALGAVAILALDPARRTKAQLRWFLGWGAAAAAVAAVVYAPWFGFVQRHGGYGALMAHHRGYMGTLATWPAHGLQQLRQATALSGGFPWNAAAWGLAALGVAVAGGEGRGRRVAALLAAGFAATIAPSALWWIGLAMLASPWPGAAPGLRLLGAAWVGMSLLTPFYHPYARLGLPLQALGWIAAAGVVGQGFGPAAGLARARIATLAACCGAAIVQSMAWPSASLPGPLGPSDSLRSAVAAARAAGVLDGPAPVRVLARPPVRFYLGGPSRVEPNAEGLIRGGGEAWALVDLAQLRQSGDVSVLGARLLERWEKVAEYPTTLNPATLLDVDPDAAIAPRPGEADAPLWLLRPLRGAPR